VPFCLRRPSGLRSLGECRKPRNGANSRQERHPATEAIGRREADDDDDRWLWCQLDLAAIGSSNGEEEAAGAPSADKGMKTRRLEADGGDPRRRLKSV
jgi:hypothetical protein